MSDGKQLDLWHVLLVAEAISGKPAEQLAEELYLAGVELPLDGPLGTSGQVSFYPEKVEDAVRLCARIVSNLPIPEKDRVAVGYVCMRMLLEDGRVPWPQPGELTEEIAGAMKAFGAGRISEAKLGDWVHSWVAHAKGRPGEDATA